MLGGLEHRALLTGNPEAVARARMKRLGLDTFFPDGEGAFGCQSVFSHEPTQDRYQTTWTGVGRDTREIRQHGSIGVAIERIQSANQEFPRGKQRVPRNVVQGGECAGRQRARGHRG